MTDTKNGTEEMIEHLIERAKRHLMTSESSSEIDLKLTSLDRLVELLLLAEERIEGIENAELLLRSRLNGVYVYEYLGERYIIERGESQWFLSANRDKLRGVPHTFRSSKEARAALENYLGAQ